MALQWRICETLTLERESEKRLTRSGTLIISRVNPNLEARIPI
jgi:hypothetical protein